MAYKHILIAVDLPGKQSSVEKAVSMPATMRKFL